MYTKMVTNQEELQQAFMLRTEVFVQEQHVPVELELDEFDKKAIHVLITNDNQAIGCGRILLEGYTAWIGRVAVRKSYRNQGIGKQLMREMMKIAKENDATVISLHAQIQVEPFYRKLGFIPHGETFMDAGIEHIEMNIRVNQKKPYDSLH